MTNHPINFPNEIPVISAWLYGQIFENSYDNEMPFLLIELQWLIERASHFALFSSEFDIYHSIIDSVIGWIDWIKEAKNIPILPDTQVQSILLNGINEKRFLKERKQRYVIAFLASRGATDLLNDYRATYLLLCFRMLVLGDFNSRIHETLDNIRYLTDKYRGYLVPFLPEITTFEQLSDFQDELEFIQQHNFYADWQSRDAQELQTFINKIRKRKPRKDRTQQEEVKDLSDKDLINQRLAEELYEFILPVQNCVEKATGITRHVTKSSKPAEVVTTYHVVDEETGNEISILASINQPSEENESVFEIDEPEFEEEAYTEVKIKKPISYGIDVIRATDQAAHQRIRSMQLLTDTRVASDYEIRIFIKSAFERISKLNVTYLSDKNDIKLSIDDKVVIYLLSVLFCGTRNALSTGNLWRHNSYYGYLEFEFKPTRAELSEDFDTDFSMQNQEKLRLVLPNKFAILLRILQSEIDTPQQIANLEKHANSYLQKLNKDKQLRLSFNKLLGYFSHILMRQGVDEAVIKILSFEPIHHLASLPYFNISAMDCYYGQQAFFSHLQESVLDEEEQEIAINRAYNEDNDLALFELITLPDNRMQGFFDDDKPQMGTSLTLQANKLKDDWVLPLLKLVNEQNPTKYDNDNDFVEFHNHLMDYLYLMLGLASGYRPVNEVFGRLEDIDLNTGYYFISDKENRQNMLGRFIILPELVIQQLIQYQTYLEFNSRYFAKKQKPIAGLFNQILQSETGLIRYLAVTENQQIIFAPNQNQNFISNRQASFAKLPLNWYRHHIRSLKDIGMGYFSVPYRNDTDKPLTSDVIGSWMGHGDGLGFDFFDSLSGLKRSKQRKLAQLLNEVLIQYGFEVIDINSLLGEKKNDRTSRR